MMLVKSICVQNFGPYSELTLDLPDRGLVLVTAPNGSGKSTLIEAVAFACFGESLRGSSMQDGEKASSAAVETEHGTITRKFGKQKLISTSFLPAEGLTTTKTQSLLEERIGTFEMWRRSSVFSADDVDRFSSMTDVNRKQFLESVTDPDGKLDDAAARCREDLRRAEAGLATATQQIAVLKERARAAEERSADAREAAKKAAPDGDVDALVSSLAKLGERVRLTTASIDHGREAADTERSESDRLRGEARTIRATAAADARALRQREHLLKSGRCGECGQEIGQAAKTEIVDATAKATRLERAAEESAAAAEVAAAKHGEAQQRFYAEIRMAESTRDALVREQAEVQVNITRLRAQETAAAAAKDRLRAALRALEEADDAIGTAEVATEKIRHEVLVLGMAAVVLGPRGVRGRLLEHVLRSVESEANAWLERLRGDHPAMRMQLQPYAEKVRGGVSDVIALKVDYGGGSYASSSRGERRRVDVALTLATSALRASPGANGGTLFLDEIMDGLDLAGVAAAAEVVQDLAREQPVVLISHNRALVQQLGQDVVHYEVDRGKLRLVGARGQA